MDLLPSRDGHIERAFPGLAVPGSYRITSPIDKTYNCIGWAANDYRWWEPDALYQKYWPPRIAREYSLQAYMEAYATLGFEACDNGNFEDGFEKIVIYMEKVNNTVTHASRQVSPTEWTSKLGEAYDIGHKFESLEGDIYGEPVQFMRRPLKT